MIWAHVSRTYSIRGRCRGDGWFALQAVTHYNDAKVLADMSTGLGPAMVGIDCRASDFYSYAARSE